MPAFWIARSRIIAPQRYFEYAKRVPAILKAFGGVVHARGGAYETLEGPDRFTRFIVIEFPSMALALACYRSAEYQDARQYRLNGVGEVELTLVDGGEFTSTLSLETAARRSESS